MECIFSFQSLVASWTHKKFTFSYFHSSSHVKYLCLFLHELFASYCSLGVASKCCWLLEGVTWILVLVAMGIWGVCRREQGVLARVLLQLFFIQTDGILGKFSLSGEVFEPIQTRLTESMEIMPFPSTNKQVQLFWRSLSQLLWSELIHEFVVQRDWCWCQLESLTAATIAAIQLIH